MTSAFGVVEKGATPLSANGVAQVLNTQAGTPFSGSAGTTVLPASNAWVASQVMPADKQRRLTLHLSYKANAATTTGAAKIVIFRSSALLKSDGTPFTGASATGQNVAPAYTDDVWGCPMVTDGTVTAAALTGTLAASTTATGTMKFGNVTYYPLAITLSAATANSAIGKMSLDVDVTDSLWVYIQAQEIGDATNRGILDVSWSLGV